MNKAYKEYSFIAHVRILKKSGVEDKDSIWTHGEKNICRRVTVEILELYKGDPRTIILEWGVGSSCDMGIRENDEWLLCGHNLDKELVSVSSCNPSLRIYDSMGERQQYDAAMTAETQLRILAGITAKPLPGGRRVYYFSNGKVSAEEEYQHGLLQGIRKVYYSNGNLMDKSEYVNGVLQGVHDHYARDGQLWGHFLYEKGHIIYSAFWYDTSSQARKMEAFIKGHSDPEDIFPQKLQIQCEGWGDTAGNIYSSRCYNRLGRLEKEHFSFGNGAYRITCEYNKSGDLQFEGYYTRQGDVTEETRWGGSGVLLSRKKWIRGKMVSQ